MKGLSAFLLKAALLPGAVCAPALVPVDAGAAAWDYVYTPTALPDGYPGGAWDLEAYGDAAPSIVNGRLYFNLRNGLFFYGRGREADPRISASDFTFEWRQEVLRPGNQFSMAMYYAEDPYNWIEFMRQHDGGIMFADGTVIMLPESPATGPHTYRLVKSDSQVELYVDGAITGSLPAGAHTVDYLELSGWGAEYAPYEAYWDHVAYTRGAYTPAELRSPTSSTTTCVEVTGVPNWKQFDDGTNNWWDDIYNHTTSSISKSGCALTAVSQVITKQWQNTDPGELNSI
jgi:hypothetical protein